MASATVGVLNLKLNADPRGLVSGFTKAQATVKQHVLAIQSHVSGMGSILAGGAASGFIGWGVKLAAEADTARIKLEALTGSTNVVADLFGQMKKISSETPILGFGMLSQSAATMIQFGVAVDRVIPSLKAIGDVTAGDAARFEMMTLAFSQMSAAGRLMGQDLLQMVNAGFNPLQEISRKTGESIGQLKARMEAGGISAQEVVDAFTSATSAGGKFDGLLKRIATESFSGKLGALKKSVEAFARTIGVAVIPALTTLIGMLQPFADRLAKIDPTILKIAVGAAAVTAGFVAFVKVAGTIVQSVILVAGALRTVAVVRAAVIALIAPKGWMELAGAAVALGVGLGAINAAFAHTTEKQKEMTTEAKKASGEFMAQADAAMNAAAATTQIGNAADGAKDKVDRFGQKIKSLVQAAESLTMRLRTPAEEMQDTIEELATLREAGLISGEVFARAFEEATKKLADANAQAESLKQTAEGIAAIDMSTSAGISALRQIERDAAKLAAEQMGREQAAAEARNAMDRAAAQPKINLEKTDKILEELLRETTDSNRYLRSLAERKGIVVREVDL